MSQTSSTYSPRARIIFKDLATGTIKPGWGDVSNDAMSLSTSKSFGRCSGTWQLMLTYNIVPNTPNKRYHELINTNDLITIEIDPGNGSGYQAVMMGLVDRVSAPRTVDAQGRPTRQVKISGQDMGKLLNEHDIGWDILQTEIDLATRQETMAGPPAPVTMKSISRLWDPRFQKGTPADFIKNLYVLTFKNVVQSSKYYSLIIDTDDKWMRNIPLFGNLKGRSLWAAMKEVEHDPYNMLHCDTASTSFFNVQLRKQPFDAQGYLARPPLANAAPWATLDDSEIISDDVGVSDCERINFLFYNPTMYQQTLGISEDVLIVHPEMTRYDATSIGLNGYHNKTIPDNFLPPGMANTNANPTPDSLTSAKLLTDLYWAWYQNNHTYGAGTFQIHTRPDIKAGSGLVVTQPDGAQKEYLVEQVSHQCTWGTKPAFTTNLQVTRGQTHV